MPIGVLAMLVLPLSLVALASALTQDAIDPAVERLAAFEEPGVLLNILPPGQGTSATASQTTFALLGGDSPPHWLDQHAMYENLVYTQPGELTDERLGDFFKRQSFRLDPAEVESVERPREGVAIVRDTFGVPHVVGETREDVMWGAGWVSGEDRLFPVDVYRYVGRGRLSEFLGPSEENLALDKEVTLAAGYSDEELVAMVNELPDRFGEIGQRGRDDIYAYSAGLNDFITHVLTHPQLLPAEYAALQQVPRPWTVADYMAIAVLTQGIFAAGGGRELDSMELYQRLVELHGPKVGCELWRDLRHASDPETPVTIDASWPDVPRERYERGCPLGLPPGSVLLDPGSYAGARPFTTLRDRLRDAGIDVPDLFSNYIVVPGERTASGHPIGVLSPQTGYFAPEILFELTLHGGGIDARGAMFPGIAAHVLLGRGLDFAWTATAGSADMIDTRVERLCEPTGSEPTRASTHYLFDGQCIPMFERIDRWVAKPSAGGQAPPEVVERRILRTRHGPVWGTATVGGQPVAIVGQRSTFSRELDALPMAVLLNENAVSDPASYLEAASYLTAAANFVFIDHKNVVAYSGGLIPKRHPDVHPDLPSWGTGEYEWQGFLPPDEHPQAVNPDQLYLTSWNNAPARDWYAGDGQANFGPVQRVRALKARLDAAAAAGVKHTRAGLVELMMDAGTVDLRAQEVVPAALDVIESSSPPEKLAGAVGLLREWVANGAMRRDRDRDGEYDHQAATALLDAWYDRMIDATLPQLTALEGEDGVMLQERDQPPNPVGSAYASGYYGYLRRVFDMALGRSAHPYQQLRCAGTGQLDDCRETLGASLAAAIEALGADPSTWNVDEKAEQIQYSATGVLGAPPMHWVNRGTFQQVVEFDRGRGGSP